LVFRSWAWGRRLGGPPAGLAAGLLGFGLACLELGFICGLFGRIALLGPGLQDLLGLSQVAQTLLPQGHLVGDVQGLRQGGLIDLFAQGQQLGNLVA